MSDAHYIFKYHLEIGLKYFTCFLDGQAIAIKLSNQINKVVMSMKKSLNSLNRVSHENLVFETIKDPQAAIYKPTGNSNRSSIPVGVKKIVINLLFMKDRCREDIVMTRSEMESLVNFKLKKYL